MAFGADLYKKIKLKPVVLIIAVVLVFFCIGCGGLAACLLIFSTGSTSSGSTSRINPAEIGSPVREGDLSIVVTGVRSTNTSYDGKTYTLDGYRVLINVKLTCELGPGEICVIDEYKPVLYFPKLHVDLVTDDTISSIKGGETIAFWLENKYWIHEDTSITGSRMEFKFKSGGKTHSAWFDIDWYFQPPTPSR